MRLFSGAVLVAALSVSFVGVNADAAQSAGDLQPTVGLVNEDLAAAFNGAEYTFGASFVDRISRDSEYNWVVLSRSVAEKAYHDGSVDAVLYIPQSFTHDILTLQELAPTKATVEYKLEPQIDERAYQMLESKIVGIVHGFNEGVVKMYYASLADSLAGADGSMHATLSNQEAFIEAMTADVQEPFSNTVPSIESFVSGATGLKDVNAAAVDAQNAFTQSVTESLVMSGAALAEQLPKIDEYTERQREIAQINAHNSNKGIADQAESDLGFYGAQFGALGTSTLCMLSGVDATGASASCALPGTTMPPHLAGRIAELRELITQYATGHGQALGTLHVDLDTRIQNLRAIEALLIAAAGPAEPTEPIEPTEPVEPAPPVDPATPFYPAILTSLQMEIQALESTRDSLYGSLPAPDLGSAMTNLDTWLDESITKVKESSLTASSVSSLGITDWSGYTPEGSGLYVDGSDELRTDITGLVSQAAQTNTQVVSSATTVPDNSDQFDALLQNADETFDNAGHVFVGLNDLIANGKAGLEENRGYYANFATVLANTRTQGVDASSIYDFFAAPVSAKNITPDRAASASMTDPMSWFDVKWVAVFGGGLLAGVTAMFIGGVLRKRKEQSNPRIDTVPRDSA